MKKKRILFLLLVVFVASLLLLGACSGKGQLATPELKKQGSTLSWEAIKNADSYVLVINDVEYPQTETSFDTTLFTTPGTYSAKVKAIPKNKKYLDSEFSNVAIFRIGIDTGNEKLDSPTGLKVKEEYLEFSEVSGANGYAVYFGDVLYKNIQVSKVKLIFPTDGDYFIKVKALGAPKAIDSDFSAALKVLVENGKVVKEQFGTPTGLYIENKVLKWQLIEGVSTYVVSISGIDQLPVIGNSFDLSEIKLPSNIELRVKAIGNSEYATSSYSEAVYYPYILKSLQNVLTLGDIITWDAVPDAVGYEVHIDQNIVKISDTKYIVDKSVNGVRKIKIRATGDGEYYLNSMFTEEFTFEVKNGEIAPYVLPIPEGLKNVNNVIFWDKVPQAISYDIWINDVQSQTTELSVVLPNENSPFIFKIRAVGNGVNVKTSPYSSDKIIYPNRNEQIKYIEYPPSLALSNGILTWEAHEKNYLTEIIINGAVYEGGSNSYNLNSLPNGKYVVKIRYKMIENNYISVYSREIFFEKPYNSIERLETPTNFRVEKKILMWDKTPLALDYDIYLDGTFLAVTDGLSYDISSLKTGKNMVFSIKAKNGTTESNISAEIGYRPDLGNGGGESNPITIANETDFWKIAERLDAHYVLTNDITLNAPLRSLGSAQIPFTGNFNGNGFTISGLRLAANSEGLFGTIGYAAIIKNVKFSDVVVDNSTGKDFGIIAGTNNGTISGVSVEFAISKTIFLADGGNFGGLVGVNYGVMEGITAGGSIEITGKTESHLAAQSIGFLCGANYGHIDGSANGSIIIGGEKGFTTLNVGGYSGINGGTLNVRSSIGTINITVNCANSSVSIGGITSKGLKDSRILISMANGINIVAGGNGSNYSIGGISADNSGTIVAEKNDSNFCINSVDIAIKEVKKEENLASASGVDIAINETNLASAAGIVLVNSGIIKDVRISDMRIVNSATTDKNMSSAFGEYVTDYAFDLILSAMVGVNTVAGNVSDCSIENGNIGINCADAAALVAGVCSVNLGSIDGCELNNIAIEQREKVSKYLRVAGLVNYNDGAVKNVSLGKSTVTLPYGNAAREVAYGINENRKLIENAEIKSFEINGDGNAAGTNENKITAAFIMNNTESGIVRGAILSQIKYHITTNEKSNGSFVAGLSAVNKGTIENCYSALVFGGENNAANDFYSIYAGVMMNEGSLAGANIGLAMDNFQGNANIYALAGTNTASGKMSSITLGLNVDTMTSRSGGNFYQYAKESAGEIKDILVSGRVQLSKKFQYYEKNNISVINSFYFAFSGNTMVDSKSEIAELEAYSSTVDAAKWTAFPYAISMDKVKTILGLKTIVEVDATGIALTDVNKIGIFSADYIKGSLPVFFSSNAVEFDADISGNISINGNGTGGKILIYFPSDSGFSASQVSLKITGYDGVTGKGTETDPYIITTENQFKSMTARPNAYYKLNQDITIASLSGIKGSFGGTLDGNGKKLNIRDVNTTCTALFEKISGGNIKNLTIAYKSGIRINARQNFSALAAKLESATIDNVGIYFEGLDIIHGGSIGSFNGLTAAVDEKTQVKNSFVTVNATIKLSADNAGANEYIDFNGLVGDNKGKINSSYFSGIVNVIQADSSKVIAVKARINEICGYNFGEIKDVFSSARVFTEANKSDVYLFYENGGSIENVLFYGFLEGVSKDGLIVCGRNGVGGEIKQLYIHNSALGLNKDDSQKYLPFANGDTLSSFTVEIWKKETSGVYSLKSALGQGKTFAPSGAVNVDIFGGDYLNILLAKKAPYDVVFTNFNFTEVDNENIKLTGSGYFTAKKTANNVAVSGDCGLANFDIAINLTISISGEGREAKPYLVKTQKDFEVIYRLAGYYALANDIIFIDTIKPIGTKEKPFNGIIDGNGYRLKNVKVEMTDGLCGLFGVLGNLSALKNLKVDNLVLSVPSGAKSKTTVGSIAAYAFGGAAITDTIISGVTTEIWSDSAFSGMVGEIKKDEMITINASVVDNIDISQGEDYISNRYGVANGKAQATNSTAIYPIKNGRVNLEVMTNKLNFKYYLEKYVTKLPLDFADGVNVKYSINPVNEKGWTIGEDGTITSGSTEADITIKIVIDNGVNQMQYNLDFQLVDKRGGTGFASGSGVWDDPYVITTIQQLQRLSDPICSSKHFAFGSDIDMTGVTNETFENLYFVAIDGKGFALNNIALNVSGEAKDVALFKKFNDGVINDGEIKDIIINSPKLTVGFTSGNTTAHIAIFAANNSKTVLTGIHIKGANVNISSTVSYIFGALAAQNEGTITSSKVEMTFLAENNTAEVFIGVVIGKNAGNMQLIEVLNTSVIIRGAASAIVGGVTAICSGATYDAIRVRAVFDIIGEKALFGGIFALESRIENDKNIDINGCTVDISLTVNVNKLTAGGLVGKINCRLRDSFLASVIAVKENITKGEECYIGSIFGEIQTPPITPENEQYYLITVHEIKSFGLNDSLSGDFKEIITGKLNGELVSKYVLDKYAKDSLGDPYKSVIYCDTYEKICDKANYGTPTQKGDIQLDVAWENFIFGEGAPYTLTTR